jgi:hypothetical protein
MKEELDKYLFREQTYTYAVLDGANVPDLPQRLFELSPRHSCLYRGELSDELIHAAPYIVHLSPGAEFTDWLFTECWGRNWGIFVQTGLSLAGAIKHFRSLLTVHNEAGDPLLFRYYDPRVLLPFLFTCSLDELNIIFGPVKYFFAESFDKAQLCRMHIANDALVETKLEFGTAEKAI